MLRSRFLEAQLGGDRRAALSVVIDQGLGAGATIGELHEHVISAAQREIGALWQMNTISIAQEHLATGIANLVLTQLFAYAEPAPRNGKSVIVACVEGEQHEFPARLVSDALDLAGFDVRPQMANVPTDSLMTVLDSHRPDLVVLSATMSFHATALREATSRIRERHGSTMPIAVGGRAVDWSGQGISRIDADLTGSDAADLVTRAKVLLGVPR